MFLLPQWAHASRVSAGAGLFAAIVAVPDRDAVSPPQLAGDAPVLDIFQPVVINLLEALRDDPDAPVPDSFQGGLRQRLDLDEPLLGDHRLDDLAAALGARHVERVGFFLDDQTGSLHISPKFFAAVKAVQTGIRPADFGHFRLPVQHRKDRQPVALADVIVVGVMPGSDLQRPGAELARHVIIAMTGISRPSIGTITLRPMNFL